MHVALVGAEVEENLGLRYLASALRRAGHEASIVAFDHGATCGSVAHALARGAYDVIGVSMMFQLRGREFCALAEQTRAAGFRGTLVAGGQFATFMAHEILADNLGIDAIVLGDGEGPLVELVAALERAPFDPGRRDALGRVAGLVMRSDDGAVVATAARAGRTPLEELAPPARDGAPRLHLGVPSAPMVASRGCYADCSFCSIVAWEKLSGGPKLRLRPPEHVASEMAALYHERGVRVFNFHDDNFWLPTAAANRTRLAALERALKARGVRDIALLLKCRPNDVDRDLFLQARDVGLVRVYVGIETDAPHGLVTLRRGVSQEQNQRALDLMAELELHACSNLLLFDPDTRLGDVPYNIAFLEQNAHHTLNFCRTEAYGGTPLTARLRAEGRLTGDYLGFDYRMRDPRVELLWRICHVVFHERNFPAEGLSNSVIGLGYRLALARRFWPGPAIEALVAPIHAFKQRFARSQARHLRTALGYVADADPFDRDFGMMFTIDLARAVREEDAALGAECEALIAAVERHAHGSSAGRSDGRLGEGAAGSGWLHVPRRVAVPTTLALGLALASAGCRGPSDVPRPDAGAVEPPPAGSRDAGAVVTVPSASEDAGVEPVTTGSDSVGPTKGVVTLSGGRTSAFGPGTEGGRYYSLFADASVAGERAADYEYERTESDTAAGTVGDVWITSTGRGVHFELSPNGTPTARRGELRIVWKNVKGGEPIVARAVFRSYADGKLSIGPAEVPATPEYVVCDPAPAPELLPFNFDKVVHIGSAQHAWDKKQGDPASARYGSVQFQAWLDDSVKGNVVSDPKATVDAGTLSPQGAYQGWSQTKHKSTFGWSYDPRGANGRLSAGTHTITVSYEVEVGGQKQTFRAAVRVVVSDDGSVVVGEKAPAHGRNDEGPHMPLERRFGARIQGARADDGIELWVQALIEGDAPAFLWRASAGELVASPASAQARWTPPDAPGRYVVTCAVQTGASDLAVASYSYDVT